MGAAWLIGWVRDSFARQGRVRPALGTAALLMLAAVRS